MIIISRLLPVNPLYSNCRYSPQPVKNPRCKARVEERVLTEREGQGNAADGYFSPMPPRSIEEPRRQTLPPLIDVHPFLFQEGSLHGEAALVSAERAVGADRPVAGDDDRKGVCRQGVAHGAGTPGRAQMGCDSPVRAHGAPRDAVFRQKDSLLKGGTEIEPHLLKGKTDVGPVEKRRDPPSQVVEEAAGGWDRIGELLLQADFRRAAPVSRSGSAGPWVCPTEFPTG